MSEAFPTDSATSTEQAEAPPPEPGAELGAGMLGEDTEPDASDAASEQPGGSAQDAAPNGAINDNIPASDENQADGLRQADYTRKTQEVADDRRQLDNERAEFRQQQAQFQETQRQVLLQQQQGPPPPGLPQQLQQVMSDPSLSAEDRAGLNVILTMSENQEAQAGVIADLRARLEQWEPQMQTTNQVVTQMSQEQQAGNLKRMEDQVQEAYTLFGQEATQAAADFIKKNISTPNRKTGQPYTVAELVGLESGRSVDDAQAARQGNRAVRQRSKLGVTSNGTAHPATTPAGGTLSKEEALREIESNMT